MLKLPKCLESDTRSAEVESVLSQDLRLLWQGGMLKVPHIRFQESLAASLAFSRRCGKLRGGLEAIETLLQREEAGLAALRKRGVGSQDAESARVSRLILMSDDGSERFYRSCESLLQRYKDRVLGCRLDVGSGILGPRFFGSNAAVKVVMVEHRDDVAKALLAMLPSRGIPG